MWYMQAIKKEILGEDSEGDKDDEDDDEEDDEDDESDEEGAGQAPVGAITQRIQVCCECFVASHTKPFALISEFVSTLFRCPPAVGRLGHCLIEVSLFGLLPKCANHHKDGCTQ